MLSDLTEKTVDSTAILDGVLLKAYRDTVSQADGHRSVREWIRHPGASAIVPLFEDGTTILVRQFRYPPRRLFLEVPAGKLDKEGESPEAVARRELLEEAGCEAATWHALGSIYPCIGYSNELIHFFLAMDLTQHELALEDGEQLIPVRLPFEEVVERAKAGALHDMKTMTALLLADAFLGRNG